MPLTYSSYLHVPQLLELQQPQSSPQRDLSEKELNLRTAILIRKAAAARTTAMTIISCIDIESRSSFLLLFFVLPSSHYLIPWLVDPDHGRR